MIDTIGLTYPISIPKDSLNSWDYGKKYQENSFFITYNLQVYAENGTSITYRYHPYSKLCTPLLKLEFSLPRLIYGDNLYMIFNIPEATCEANQKLPSIPGVPDLDLRKGKLHRLDICHNFQVAEFVPYYIDSLQHLEYSRRRTEPYSTRGVQFRNKQTCLKFYDKERSYIDKNVPVNPEAKGVLRMEATLKKDKIKKLTDKENPNIEDIYIESLTYYMDLELKKLGLYCRSIGTYDTTLPELCQTFGWKKGVNLYGFMVSMESYPTIDAFLDATGMEKRSCYRYLKNIKDGGYPLTITKNEKPLPPLTIDREAITALSEQDIYKQKWAVVPQVMMSEEIH